MPKGTFRAEAMSNSEKNQAEALAVIELHLFDGISQPVENSDKYIYIFNSVATY